VKTLYAAKTISVGVHPTVHVFGLAIDTDIVTSTLLAAAIFLYLGFRMVAKVTDGVPSKIQIFWEFLYDQVTDLAESAMDARADASYDRYHLAALYSHLQLDWVPPLGDAPGSSGEILPAPTSDVNLPLAMALLVVCWVHVESFRARGFKGYFRHYRQPYAALAPINVIEEITKPITLTFRLFGNLFSGGLMVAVMTTLLPIYVVPFGEIIWKPFDLFIGAIQAYIFMLLTILYFTFATSNEDHNDAAHEVLHEASH